MACMKILMYNKFTNPIQFGSAFSLFDLMDASVVTPPNLYPLAVECSYLVPFEGKDGKGVVFTWRGKDSFYKGTVTLNNYTILSF